jgi:endonuclease/exonuclease/phosphatase family metal-dependent hydrolase/dienelactone hydrolase
MSICRLLHQLEFMIAHLIPSKAILPFATLVWLVLSPALWNAAHCQTAENNAIQPDAADTKSNSQILRVLSYNIHHAAGTDGKLDLQRIANVIQSVDPDVVSLQEVDRLARRSGSIDQPSELARLTGMRVCFAENIPLQGGSYGNAILTRFPIDSNSHALLPNHDKGEQRGLLRSRLHWQEVGKPAIKLNFTATHFDHRRNDTERVASALQVNEIALSDPETPSLIAGDFNDVRGSTTLDILQKQWTIAGPTLPTIPAAKPTRQIDFILFRPKNRWTIIKTQVLKESVASDHRAILSVLRLNTPEKKPRNAADIEQQNSDELSEKQLQSERESLLQTPAPSGQTRIAKTATEWIPRKKSILNAMQSVMGRLPEFESLNVPEMELLEEIDCGDYVRRKILYRSQAGNRTPAFLCVPKAAFKKNAKPLPAVLCLHPTDNVIGNGVVVGLGGKANRQYASELATRGYVTLAPAYPLLADYQPDVKALGWESGTLLAVWDNIRGIDLLCSLPFVKRDAIGAIGHSLGGHNAIYTAAFDKRIAAVVSSCGFDSYQDYYGGDQTKWIAGKGWTQLRYMPKLANYQDRLDEIPFDFDEILATIAPRPILVVAPLHDSNFQAASVSRLVKNAGAAYALHGAEQSLQLLQPDCAHDFPNQMRAEAYLLFDQVLNCP